MASLARLRRPVNSATPKDLARFALGAPSGALSMANMDAAQQQLALFVLARLGEEEALANRVIADRNRGIDEGRWSGDPIRSGMSIWVGGDSGADAPPALAIGAERVLADCQVRAAMLVMFRALQDAFGGLPVGGLLQGSVAQLAAPYTDHPDYRPEWRLLLPPD